MVNRFLAVILSTLIIFVSAPPASAQDDGGEVVVRVGLQATEKNLNPFMVHEAQPFSHDLTMLVYDTLFWTESQLDPDPWLATEAQSSEDFRTWTVTLRDDVLWQDGEAFTADDVAFTYQYFRDIGGPGRYGRQLYLHPILQSATVIDNTTVEFSFAEPVPSFRMFPGADVPILPEHIWSGVADPRADTTTLPVGTGPYRLVEHQPDTSYRFEANESYFLGAPLVDTLLFSVVADQEAAFAALEAGDLDIVGRNVPWDLEQEFQQNPDVSVLGGNRYQTVYLMFNQSRPGLNDPKVRKAISLAIDTNTMLNTLEGGQGRDGTDTWTHPSSPWTRNPEEVHIYDLPSSNQLLDGNGYGLGDSGIRVGPDGQELSFSLGLNPAIPNHSQAAEMVVQELAKIGVSVTVQPLSGTEIAAARGADPAAVPAVDILLDEVETSAQMDPNHLYFLFNSTAGGIGPVFGQYANPEFDALTTQALGVPEADRWDLIHQAQDILATDVPVLTLYYPAIRAAYRPAVYDGWWSDQGHGVITKRAFLPDYADSGLSFSSAEEEVREPAAIPESVTSGELSTGPGSGPGLTWILIAVAAIGAGGTAFTVLRKRSGTERPTS